jgi:GntR family transcriptional regulator
MTERSATLTVDLNSGVPVYRQIMESLRTLLVGGELRPGDNLPTVRDLALDLGVHFNTVAEAYRALAEEGWLDLKRRRGATVIKRAAPKADAEHIRAFERRLREMIAQARSDGVPLKTIAEQLQLVAEGLQ